MRSRCGRALRLRLPLCLLPVLFALLLLPGCGGGRGGADITTRARFTVRWPAQGRAENIFEAPRSAVSVRFTLPPEASPRGGSIVPDPSAPNAIVTSAPRTSGRTEEHLATYTTTEDVRAGRYQILVEFFSKPVGTATPADLVAVATLEAEVGVDGDVTGTFTVGSRIDKVTVTPGQSVTVGQTLDVQVTATAENGDVIAFLPASGAPDTGAKIPSDTVPASSPNDRFRIVGGLIEGVSAGSDENVIVEIDGVRSDPTPVTVNPSGIVVTLQPGPLGPAVISGTTHQFTATVIDQAPGARNNTNTGVVWTAKLQGTDQDFGTITQTGLYTPPENMTNTDLSTAPRVTIRATSEVDRAKSAEISVPVTGPLPIRVTILRVVGVENLPIPGGIISVPANSTDLRSTLQFTATLENSTDPRVSWAVLQADGGTITPDGLYTPPARRGNYTVRATSVAAVRGQPGSAEITVQVQSGGVHAIVE